MNKINFNKLRKLPPARDAVKSLEKVNDTFAKEFIPSIRKMILTMKNFSASFDKMIINNSSNKKAVHLMRYGKNKRIRKKNKQKAYNSFFNQ